MWDNLLRLVTVTVCVCVCVSSRSYKESFVSFKLDMGAINNVAGPFVLIVYGVSGRWS